ncbi:hypothetical protein EDC04DRAFT_2698590 [Pisolithus marmoratus]|nr:hypothetical protein EDC04DRAFT_2698590 [Pisolithus marmoratus]
MRQRHHAFMLRSYKNRSRAGLRHAPCLTKTFECLLTPLGSPTWPCSSATNCDAGGLQAPTSNSMYDAVRQAVLDGMPVDVLCHLVLLEFVRNCADMAEAVYDEQQHALLASGVSISDNKLKLFHPVQMQHLEELMDIADGVMNNLEHCILELGTRH